MTRESGERPCSELLDLVMDMNWEAVIRHAQLRPQDASFLDGEWIETPLYCACQHSPPAHAIKALIDAFPRALKIMQSKNKDVPLHIACRYRTSIQVLTILVDANPQMSLFHTRWGKTPLVALCDGFEQDDEESDEEEKWGKMEVLLRGVARAQNLVNREGQLLLVHAAVSLGSLGCPSQVLDQVLRRCHHQVQEKDPLGRLPLHVATGKTKWSPQMRRRYKPRELKVIKALLKMCPDAIYCPFNQQLVLHRAIRNGHTWYGGVQALFQAHPDAGVLAEQWTQLLPFMLAAVPVGDSQPSLDTIYHLLRNNPHVLLNHSLQPFKISRDTDEMNKFRNRGHLKRIAIPFVFASIGVLAVSCYVAIAFRHR